MWVPLTAQTLEIRIVEGEGMGYPAGSRATRGIAVQVIDDGKPAEGATVVFLLPASGPTGVFISGERMELAVTGADGRASVWGMHWNRVTGPLELRITATKGQGRASVVCPLELTEAEAKVARSHRKIWIGLAVAGGVVGAAVVRAAASPASTNGTTPMNPPTLGTPTIAISHP
jgi:hypothetical protein